MEGNSNPKRESSEVMRQNLVEYATEARRRKERARTDERAQMRETEEREEVP